VRGELDALTAPAVAAVITDTLAVAQVVVVNLDGVHHLASAGLRVLIEANITPLKKAAICSWCATPRVLAAADSGSISILRTACRSPWASKCAFALSAQNVVQPAVVPLAQLVLLEADVDMDAVGPQVDVVHPGQIAERKHAARPSRSRSAS
jgi:anti-anti-sigma factor